MPKAKSDKENLKIWDAVYETDEKYLKDVKIGSREFKAIDPYYQIKKITEYFGPCGIGWYYTVEKIEDDQELVAIKLEFTYRAPGTEEYSKPIPVMTAVRARNKSGADHEAYKKAVTDALTKAFSVIGCDAGVFLGEFDGNKYTDNNSPDAPSEASGDSATEKQINYLDKLADKTTINATARAKNMDPNNLTKEQASELIEELKGEK